MTRSRRAWGLSSRRSILGSSTQINLNSKTARWQPGATKGRSISRGAAERPVRSYWCRRSDSNRQGLVVRRILSSVGEGDRRTQLTTPDTLPDGSECPVTISFTHRVGCSNKLRELCARVVCGYSSGAVFQQILAILKAQSSDSSSALVASRYCC